MKIGTRIKGITDNVGNPPTIVKDTLLGAIGALLMAIVYVGLYALAMYLFRVGDNTMPVVNVIAKAICMLVAAVISVWRRPLKGWLKGGIAGGLYVILAFVLFSLIDGDWSVGWPFLADLVMGIVVGAIGGILFVNLRKAH